MGACQSSGSRSSGDNSISSDSTILFPLFRNWLLKLQEAYDQDKERGVIDDEGWTREASDDAVLAYKLLVQVIIPFPVRVQCNDNTYGFLA